MKRKKRITRILSLFLTVVMLLSSLGTSVLSAEAEPVNTVAGSETPKEQKNTEGGGVSGKPIPETSEPAQSRAVETPISEGSISTTTVDAPETLKKTQDSTEAPKETQGSTEAPKETQGSTEAPKETQGSTEAPKETQGSTEAPKETQGSTEAPKETEGSTETVPKETEGSTETVETPPESEEMKEMKYRVSFDQHAADFGTILIDGTPIDPTVYAEEVKENTGYCFRIEAAQGYEVEKVRVNEEEIFENGQPNEYQIKSVMKDTVITVTYAKLPEESEDTAERVVTFQSEEGVIVTVDGADATNGTAMAKDGTIIFTVTAEDGFAVTEVLVDGTILARETGNPDEYIIEGIQTDATVVTIKTASEETEETEEETELPAVENLVTFQVAEGATVVVDGNDVTNSTAAAKDGKIVFTAAPTEGFRISEVLVDGDVPARETGNTGEYIIEGIHTDDTVVTVNTAPTEEEKETEETEEPEKPAQTMTVTASDGATVIITAPQGALPEGAQVIAQAISSASIESAVENAVEAEGKTLVDYKAYDITIIDGEGNVIQPDASVQVTINNAGVAGEETSVYHVDGAAADKVAEVSGGDYAAFAAAHFSIYVVAGSQIQQPEADEVLVTYRRIRESGVAVEAPYTVAYDLQEGGTTTKYQAPPETGYTITMEADDHFAFDPATRTVTGTFSEKGSYEVILTYTPKDIRYKVTHKYQSLDGSYDRDVETETLTGKVDTMTDAQERTREGFTVEPIHQIMIAPNAKDDNIEVEVKYSRNECLLLYSTMGGSYIESEILLYGTTVDLNEIDRPTREGYRFTGWFSDKECTKPVNEIEVTEQTTYVYAGWEGRDVKYTVVYMQENADDDGYSYVDSLEFTAQAGTTVTVDGSTRLPDGFDTGHFTFDHGTSGEIMPDGSTVLNVYYRRNVYTISFAGTETYMNLICVKTEHTHTRSIWNSCYELQCTAGHRWDFQHTDECYVLTCTREEHAHDISCYETDRLVITAKYGQNIKDLWNAAVGPGTDYEGDSWTWDGSQSTGFQSTMPGENKELTESDYNAGENGGVRHELHYYIENPNGSVSYNNKQFELYTDVVLEVSRGENVSPTFDEEFFAIDGYDRYGSTILAWQDGNMNGTDRANWDRNGGGTFYYSRAYYPLELINEDYSTSHDVPYLSDISGYLGEPDINPIAGSTFGGWYLDPEFTTPFNAEGAVMPKGLSLYARWIPATHTVTFWDGETVYKEIDVVHGQPIIEGIDRPDYEEEYIFDGWYTTPECTEGTDFDFNKPVTEDTNVYMKWTPITDTTYTVRYMTEGGRGVATDKHGSGTVGETIIEEAVKPTNQYAGYTVDEATKELTLKANPSENVIIFTYSQTNDLKYTVQYVCDGVILYEVKDIPSEANHLVVHPEPEAMEELDKIGYEVLDHHQEVDLTAEGPNIVTFDCVKSQYSITYDGLEGSDFEADNPNPTTYAIDSQNIVLENPTKEGYEFTGWEFDTSTGGYVKDDDHNKMQTVISTGSHGDLTFRATWRQIEYTVSYNTNGGTPDTIAAKKVAWESAALLPGDTVTRYGYTFKGWKYGQTDVAPETTYASLAGSDDVLEITLTAQWEEDPSITVPVHYVTDPTTAGTLSRKSDNIQIISADGLQGSAVTATANGYTFNGWYQGETLVTKDEVLTAELAEDHLEHADGTYAETTFTARFAEKDEVTLTYVANPTEGGTVSKGSQNIKPVTGTPTSTYATANKGYKFISWTVGDSIVGENRRLTPAQIAAAAKKDGVYTATTFTANFEIDPTQTVPVTYKADPRTGGTVDNASDTIQMVDASGLEVTTATANTGYKFVGWFRGNETEAFTANPTLDIETIKGALNFDTVNNVYLETAFTAKFEADENQTAKVVYKSQNTTMGTVTVSEEELQVITGNKPSGEALTGSRAVANAGYKFLGWYKGDTRVSTRSSLTGAELKNALTKEGNLYQDTTFVARFDYDDSEAAQATITYVSQDENQGTVDPGSESIHIVPDKPDNTPVGSTATPKPGYKIEGWYKGGVKICSEAQLTPDEVKANLNRNSANGTYTATTFEARFVIDEEQTAVAEYRSADRTMGRVNPRSSEFQIVDADGLVGSTATPRSGYRFVGWYLDDDTTTPISTDAELTAEVAKANLNKDTENGTYADTSFTARFEIDPTQTVPVHYVSESDALGGPSTGSVDPKKNEIQIRTADGLTGSTATPEPGYKFTGWYLAENTLVTENETLDDATAEKYLNLAADGSYAETTFYAGFDEEANVTLRYYANPRVGGTLTRAEERLAPATGKSQGSEAKPANGYKFVNWTLLDGTVVSEEPILTPEQVDQFAKNADGIYVATSFIANFTYEESKTATITYVADPEAGGTVSNPNETIQIVPGNPNASVTGSTAKANAGYRFVGWFKGNEPISDELTIDSATVKADLNRNQDQTYADTIFTARFEPDLRQRVMVTYKTEDEKKGTVDRHSDSIQIVTGEPLYGSTATPKPGYEFVGWFKDDETEPITTEAALTADIMKEAGALNKNDDGNFAPTTFTARFAYDESQEVTITYVSANEQWGTVNPESEDIQIVPGNQGVSLTGSEAAAKHGYKFVGWYKGTTFVSSEAKLEDVVIKNALDTDANGNYAATTFTARFDYDENALANVTYVSEDMKKGTVDNANDTIQIVPENQNVSIKGSTAAPTDGYKFEGWYVGGKKIADAKETLDQATVKANLATNDDGTYKDTEFTARFAIDETKTAEVLYISENPEMGTVSLGKETVQIVTGNTPTGDLLTGSVATAKAGYKFTGWKKSVNGADVVVTDKEALDGKTAKANLNVENERYATTTFIATFTEKENVTLTYVANPTEGGTVTNSPENLKPATGSSAGSVATASDGYKFVNWTVDGAVVGTEATLTPAQVDAVAKKTGAYEAATFTANFEIDPSQTVDVTYEAQPAEGGSVTNDKDTIQIVTANGLTGSEAKAATGYKFVGWYKGDQVVTENEVLDEVTALAALERGTDKKTYVATNFIAKFEIDPSQTKDLSATVDYMLAKDVQTADHVDLKATVQVLQPDTLSTAGVTAKNYPGWKLDKITVNGKTVETLPAEVENEAKVIYHYAADFSSLDAAGFEEFYNGQAHQVSVTGALESDVIRYYVADTQTEQYAAMVRREIQNSFVNVSDSAKVTVEVTRGSSEQTWTKTVDAAVKPVDVELTADSAEKTYDGTPLVIDTYKISDGAFVADEGLERVTIEGSQTYVGSSKAEIKDYTFKKNTLEENYNITCKPGTLTVTEEGVDPEDVMTKTHEDKTYGLGDEITFTIRVKNIYDKNCDITIIEQQGVKITGETKFTAVKPGEEVVTTAVYTVTEADLIAGEFKNTVTAKIDENTHTATDKTDTFEETNAHLTVKKESTSTPKDGVAYTLGEKITYEVTAVNDGNLTLTDVVVMDELTEDIWMVEALKPGESKTFTAEHLVTEADIVAGTVKNVATASAKTPDPDKPQTTIVPGETEDPVVTPKESLWFEKKVDSEKDEYKVGEIVDYTLRVVNNGNVTISNVEVRDPLTDDVWTVESLAPGEAKEFKTTYEVTEEDAEEGKVINTATVIGEDAGGDPINTRDTVIVGVDPKPSESEKETETELQTEPQTEPQTAEAPKTGDETNIAQWLLMMVAAAGVFFVGAASRRRRRS